MVSRISSSVQCSDSPLSSIPFLKSIKNILLLFFISKNNVFNFLRICEILFSFFIIIFSFKSISEGKYTPSTLYDPTILYFFVNDSLSNISNKSFEFWFISFVFILILLIPPPFFLSLIPINAICFLAFSRVVPWDNIWPVSFNITLYKFLFLNLRIVKGIIIYLYNILKSFCFRYFCFIIFFYNIVLHHLMIVHHLNFLEYLSIQKYHAWLDTLLGTPLL